MSEHDPEAELGVERKRWPLWKILVVVAVLSAVPCVLLTVLVASIAMPAVLQSVMEASQAQAKADIDRIEAAVIHYALLRDGQYPASLDDLPDYASAPEDPWGRAYVYEPPPRGTDDYRILTYGADGTPGGEGPNLDIDHEMLLD